MRSYHCKKQVLVLITILFVANLFSQPFVNVSNSIPGTISGRVITAGFNRNNDYQDILITGESSSSPRTLVTNLYKNDGSFNFSSSAASFSALCQSSLSATDYDRDGDMDFIMTGLNSAYNTELRLYRNDGSDAFTQINTGIVSLYDGSIAWGDYDNDGDQDIAITGATRENIRKGRIYRNEGGDVFTELDIQLPAVLRGSISWGDYDNDGDLDLLMSGVLFTPVFHIFRNDGNEVFTELYTGIEGAQWGNSSWGDFDNDGDLDILITGMTTYERKTRIYRNNGGSFTLSVNDISDVGYSSAAWGDYDCDGDLDILSTGESAGGTVSAGIHRNNGNGTFTNINAGLEGIKEGTAVWCDLDLDNDLDVILSGKNQAGNYIFRIYRNDKTPPGNNAPGKPLNPSSVVSGANVTLNWTAVTSDETLSPAMSYNIKIGTSSGSIDIVSPDNSVAGVRKLSAMGNGQLGTSFQMKNLKKDQYFWSVQAVDNGFRGGIFSDQGDFTITANAPASKIKGTVNGSSGISLKWIRGNSDNCIVFAKQAASGTASPVDNENYTANSVFGAGEQIAATGWFCVYTGPRGFVTVAGLEPEKDYIFHVIEYDGSTGNETYFTQTSSGNPASFKTDLFTDLAFDCPGFVNASANWVDFDNDGKLDAFMSGRIYKNGGGDLFTYVASGLSEGSATAYPFDYNNDGKMDLMMNYFPASSFVNSVFTGTGNNTFTLQSSAQFPSLSDHRNAVGDYDNDGDIDILLTGTTSTSTNVTKLYRNNGDNSFTEQTGTSFTGIKDGAAIFGDFDNDNYLDIVISGNSTLGNISRLYHNNGNRTFTEITGTNIPGLTESCMDAGDIDNDGDLDILIAGNNSVAKVLLNNGNNTFSDANAGLGSFSNGACDLGDYDNDGDLDLLIMGWIGGGCATKIYKNNGNNTFTAQNAINILGLHIGSLHWGDYDNDGDLDIITLGADASYNYYSKIYRNDIISDNVKPAKVSGLSHTVTKENVTIQWNNVTGDATPSQAITYNVKIGRALDGIDVLSPASADDGFRKIPEPGNMLSGTSAIIKNLVPDDYYWRVQAIDHSFAGGSFSDGDIFNVPYFQAEGLSGTIMSPTSILLRWTRGNGERCVVFCRAGITGTAIPQNNKTYVADPNFGYGTQIVATDWYCVYNGRADSVLVTGLSMNSDYVFQVIEYLGSPGNEQYYTATSETNPAVFGTGIFNELATAGLTPTIYAVVSPVDYNNDGKLDVSISGLSSGEGFITRLFTNDGDNTFSIFAPEPFTGFHNGFAKWGDYDNDGYLDLLMGGSLNFSDFQSVTKIYHNNSGTSFTEIAASLPGVYYSAADWGDYDNDGYLDFIIAGYTGTTTITKIFHNNGGNGTFTDINASLQGVKYCSVEWGDSDNDGDLDVLVQGDMSSNNAFTKLYRNDGGNVFTPVTCGLPDSYVRSDLSWGDYDNDGFSDILFAGGIFSGIYRNNGNNTFTKISASMIEATQTSANWGDYDNDGDLDFLITGTTETGLTTSIYRNDGNGAFSLQSGYNLPSLTSGSAAWGDYDNDGDIDIFLAGISSGYIAKVLRNNTVMTSGGFTANSKPVAPTDLTSSSLPGGVLLKWKHVKNDESVPKTMTYNIRIGIAAGNSNKYPASSDLTSGQRRIVKIGNVQLDTTVLVKNLPSGIYYWGVQAVDQGYKGGSWSTIESFEVKNVQTFFSATEVCLGLPTQFTDQSVATKGIASWLWEFGDGTTSTSQHPQHTYATSGTFSVKLTITDTESSTDFLIKSVNVKPKPTANFTATTVCQGTPTPFTNTTNNNGLTIPTWFWDFGDGQTFTGQNPPAHGYLGAANYTVLLRAQADNGCIDEISKTVTVAAYPVAAVSADGATTFCTGQSVTLSTPLNAQYTYSWKRDGNPITGANTNSYLASISGSYTVAITNTVGSCLTNSSGVSVTANTSPAAPLISASGPLTFCQGQSVDLSVTYTDGYSYQWKLNGGAVGTNSNIYSATASGTYSLEVANASGCKTLSSNTVNVTVNSNPSIPTVNISGPTTFCQGNNVELSVTPTGGYTYQWENNSAAITGATSTAYIANISGVFSLKITNANNCISRTENVNVSVLSSPAAPTITASGPATFCQDGSILLSVDNTPGYSYQWKLNGGIVGSNSNAYTASASGTYNLTVTNASNCSVSSSNNIAVTVNPKPALPTVNISGPTSFCQGGSVELSVSSASGFTYQWENNSAAISGATLNKLTANTSGVYALKITNNDNCFIKSENITVNVLTIPSAPTISASSATTFCQGDSVVLSVSNTPGYSYQWRLNGGSVGTNSNQFVAKTSGSYDIVVSNSSGCSVTSLVPVAVVANPLPVLSIITVKGEEKFCSGESTNLSVPANKDYIYAWKKGTGDLGLSTNSIDVTESGNYTVELNLAGCKLTAEPVAIEVVAKPARPDIDPGTYKKDDCLGDNPPVLSVDNLVPGYTYQWYKNETPLSNATSIEVTESGNYYLEAVVDICTSERALAEIVFPAALPKPDLTAKGPTIWILSTSSKAEQYKWFYNGDHIPTADNKSVYLAGQNMGTYRVAISNDGKCFSFSDKKTIPDIVGIEEPDPFKDVRIYPNPTTGLFTIEMNNNVFGELVIDIITQNGSKILNIKFDKSTEHFMSQIDLSGQPNGMYLINLSLDKFRAVRKVLVE